MPIRVNEFNYWTNAWLVIVIYYLSIFLQQAGVQSSSGQSFVTTPGENEQVELMECEATMSEGDE